MKRNALLLFLALLLAAPVARGYDFRKTVKGNTLYFSILPGDSTVAVTAPFGKDGGWGDRAKPSGRLSIPAQVQQDGQRYEVVAVESGAFLECDALVGVRVFDEKGHLVVDEQIPHDQPVDNYYIKLPKKQRYFLRFDMGAPHVVDVERQEVR